VSNGFQALCTTRAESQSPKLGRAARTLSPARRNTWQIRTPGIPPFWGPLIAAGRTVLQFCPYRHRRGPRQGKLRPSAPLCAIMRQESRVSCDTINCRSDRSSRVRPRGEFTIFRVLFASSGTRVCGTRVSRGSGGVRTEDSQSSNPGSIPGSATKSST
jgi:hypothetical protein